MDFASAAAQYALDLEVVGSLCEKTTALFKEVDQMVKSVLDALRQSFVEGELETFRAALEEVGTSLTDFQVRLASPLYREFGCASNFRS